MSWAYLGLDPTFTKVNIILLVKLLAGTQAFHITQEFPPKNTPNRSAHQKKGTRMFKEARGFRKPRLGYHQRSIAFVFYSCITNCHKVSGLNYLTHGFFESGVWARTFKKVQYACLPARQWSYFKARLGKGPFPSSRDCRQNLNLGGCYTQVFSFLLPEFKSLWLLQSGLPLLAGSLRLPSVSCHRGPFKTSKGGSLFARGRVPSYLM